MSSFVIDKIMMDGFTSDDIPLAPAYSEVLLKEVQLKTRFSRRIEMNAPFVSAAMDITTEPAVATAIAREGGIGVIHKDTSIEEQAHQVAIVKRTGNGMIYGPATVRRSKTVWDALEVMRSYHIGGTPVAGEDGHPVDIVTNRNLCFKRRLDKAIDEVTTHENLVTTYARTGLTVVVQILQEHKIERLPVVDVNNKLMGLITYKDITKAKDKPMACKDEEGRLRVAAGVGVTVNIMERPEALAAVGTDAVVIDTAHGYPKGVIEKLRETEAAPPNIDIVVGNVATATAAKLLVDNGADVVKVGIGSGLICTTRVVVGVGVSRLPTVHNVFSVLRDTDVSLTVDGGLRYSSDVVKALAAGGSLVMVGSSVAGTEEGPDETIIFNGRKFKSYRGTGSLEVMEQKNGSKDRYFQADTTDAKKLVSKGIAGRVPHKETVQEAIYQLMGGLCSGMGYRGAATIEELHHAKFVRITSAGVLESHPHDVSITSEALNYSRLGQAVLRELPARAGQCRDMKKTRKLLTIMLCYSSMALAQQTGPIVMTINGQPTMHSESEYSHNENNVEGAINKKTVDEYADLLINYKLKVMAAQAAKANTAHSFKAEFVTYYDQQIRPATITDADVEQHTRGVYRESQQRVDGAGGLVKPAHILFGIRQIDGEDKKNQTKQRVDLVYNALLKGADFAALA